MDYKTVTLDEGSRVMVANTQRSAAPIDMILLYKKSLPANAKMLSMASYFRILRWAVATRRKSVSCVDYYKANAGEVSAKK
jgi:hypothetical protein